MGVSYLVGALSPVNHRGLHQGWERENYEYKAMVGRLRLLNASTTLCELGIDQTHREGRKETWGFTSTETVRAY